MKIANCSVFPQAFLFLCTILLVSQFAMAGPPASFPAPEETKSRLFYLQRSSNSNTIVYDVNILGNQKINPKEPVEVYWMRYNSDGAKKALSFVERKFAYGLSFDRINSDVYTINLTAYADRDITIFINGEGKAEAHLVINGQSARLKRIYLDISGSGFWTSVNSVELMGIDLKNNQLDTEKFDPNEDFDE